jgi:hypothetical protein
MAKISFTNYWENLGNLKNDLRNKIMDEMEISNKTFYNRVNKDDWTILEREKLQEILNNHIDSIKNTLLK